MVAQPAGRGPAGTAPVLQVLQTMPVHATQWINGRVITRQDTDAYSVGGHSWYTHFSAARVAELVTPREARP